MAVETNKNIAQRWIKEARGGVNLGPVHELVTADYVVRTSGLPDASGREGIKGRIGPFRDDQPQRSSEACHRQTGG